MALASAFQTLSNQLRELNEALLALRTTSREDKPLSDDAVLVDVFGDAADDLLGWLEGALQAARDAQLAAAHPTDLNRAWRALSACQQRFSQVQQRYHADLNSYERIAELTEFGQQRGGEWQAWATSVKAGLDDCRDPIDGVNQAIFGCWQEIGERVGARSVTVQTTNIGQHLALASEE